MRVLEVPPPSDTSAFQGAQLKVAFDKAIREGYDVVVHWKNPRQNGPQLVAALTEALEQNVKAAGVYATSPHAHGWRTWRSHLWSRLMGYVSGHTNIVWWSIGRAYRTEALARIAYELNTYEAHFEVEVLLELLAQRAQLVSVPGPENDRRAPLRPGLQEMFQSLKAALKYRLQAVNLFYDFRFHPEQVLGSSQVLPSTPYRHKLLADSPHRLVCKDPGLVPLGSRVLDIGCASGYVARQLVQERGCQVIGVDCLPADQVDAQGFEYHYIDLEKDPGPLWNLLGEQPFDVILVLDVLEHLSMPELFLLQLYRTLGSRPTSVVVSTGNVAFFIVRLMLLVGYFNYGNKGILDITHKRLFSVRTFKNLMEQTGFKVRRRVFFPFPFQELGFPAGACQWLERINRTLLRLRPSLFAYQILFASHSIKRIERPNDLADLASSSQPALR